MKSTIVIESEMTKNVIEKIELQRQNIEKDFKILEVIN